MCVPKRLLSFTVYSCIYTYLETLLIATEAIEPWRSTSTLESVLLMSSPVWVKRYAAL
jgi:hypothetical protein